MRVAAAPSSRASCAAQLHQDLTLQVEPIGSFATPREDERRIDGFRSSEPRWNGNLAEPLQLFGPIGAREFYGGSIGAEANFVQRNRLVESVLSSGLQPVAFKLRHHIGRGFAIAFASGVAPLQRIVG